jgi:2-oxoglutarate dehydrogenase E2 component (dihydrolipoamide succinyltransferase)
VGTEKGLVVPVLRDADALAIAEIEKEIGRAGPGKARAGKLTIEEHAGRHVHHLERRRLRLADVDADPQPAAVRHPRHAQDLQDRPVVVNGQIVIRPMMYLALSYDHRIVDGKEAVTFLVRVKESLEDPERLVLDL